MSTTPISRHERGYVSLAPDLPSRMQARPSDGYPLIVHADDFGETAEITDGICEGIEAGVVTSTSIVANMPATQYALGRVRSLAERASFGVHLNLCEGRPLTPGPSLRGPDGEFHGKRALIGRAVLGRLSALELRPKSWRKSRSYEIRASRSRMSMDTNTFISYHSSVSSSQRCCRGSISSG